MATLLQSLNPFVASASPPTATATATVEELRIYPIKSCRGIAVRRGRVTRKGLDLDRHWMFAAPDGAADEGKLLKFVTIREISELTLVNTALEPAAAASPSSSSSPSSSPPPPSPTTTSPEEAAVDTDADDLQLVISIGGGSDPPPPPPVRIPARLSASWLAAHTTLAAVSIWGAVTDGWVYGDAVNAPVRAFLGGCDVRLVYKGPSPRVLRGNGAPAVLGREEETNFPDVLPLLLANAASLDELNARLAARQQDSSAAVTRPPLTIERFRPNIVVRGGGGGGASAMPAWSEDGWKRVRIVDDDEEADAAADDVDIDVQARCARCQVPNVDPGTGAKDAREPWATLVGYRRVDPGVRWKPCFGMLACPRTEGRVRVGARLDVAATTAEHVYIKGF